MEFLYKHNRGSYNLKETGTNLAVALLFPELQTILISQEAH